MQIKIKRGDQLLATVKEDSGQFVPDSKIQGMEADEMRQVLAAAVFVLAERFNTDEIDISPFARAANKQ